jgi:hypothetical protein
MALPSRSRRRQRSVRVAVAVALLSAVSVLVLGALLAGSTGWLTAALLLSLAAGWAAARILHTELVQTRRAHARERALQARAFRQLFTERSAEHAAFARAMTARLAARDRSLAELEATLRLSEVRAVAAEDRVRREARRTADAQARVGELEVALAIRTAEEADELASWQAGGPLDAVAEADTVVDLLAWEGRVSAVQAEEDRAARRRA